MPSPIQTARAADASRPAPVAIPATGDAASRPSGPPTLIEIRKLSLRYGTTRVLDEVSFPIHSHCVTALIGPSGCGKSSLLRCLNRMNDLVHGTEVQGEILLGGVNLCSEELNTTALRRRVGMVFQRSNPFPNSVYDNVAYGIRLHKLANSRSELDSLVEQALVKVGLWDEVKDRLRLNALALSGGQQQRLCIARSIAVRPHILLMDEPASALDPIATAKIEELIQELKHEFTIIIVTHNLHQAGRCSDYVAFLYMGRLIEFGSTRQIFTAPRESYTEAYIMGRFG